MLSPPCRVSQAAQGKIRSPSRLSQTISHPPPPHLLSSAPATVSVFVSWFLQFHFLHVKRTADQARIKDCKPGFSHDGFPPQNDWAISLSPSVLKSSSHNYVLFLVCLSVCPFVSSFCQRHTRRQCAHYFVLSFIL